MKAVRPASAPLPLLPILLVLLLTLTGCTVGPDYLAPSPETLPGVGDVGGDGGFVGEPIVEDAFEASGDVASPDVAGPAPESAWWAALGDPTLVELVDRALAHNLDLEVADARIRQARAARRAVAADGRPSVGAGLSGERSRASENTPEGALASAGLSELETDRFELGLSASWEIDVFGGVRRASQAADARLGEVIEGRRARMLGLVAEVARAYTELRGHQRRLALAEKNVGLQEETLRRQRDLHRVGLGSRLDVERATAQLEGTRSRLPPLRAEIRAAAHRLAVLGAEPPSALLEGLLEAAPLADPPDLVPVGLPSELLRRRPDLRMAERRLAASSAEIGVATANLYPRFFLTGAGGAASDRFSDLFRSASRTWRLGPSIQWPIFQGGRLRAGIEAAEAGHEAALAEYRQAVLHAVEDVETALVRYAEEELRRRSLEQAAEAGAEAARLARVVYDKGLESFLVVLDAERTLVELEDALAVSETAVVLRLVAVYAALGGGWEGMKALTPGSAAMSEKES